MCRTQVGRKAATVGATRRERDTTQGKSALFSTSASDRQRGNGSSNGAWWVAAAAAAPLVAAAVQAQRDPDGFKENLRKALPAGIARQVLASQVSYPICSRTRAAVYGAYRMVVATRKTTMPTPRHRKLEGWPLRLHRSIRQAICRSSAVQLIWRCDCVASSHACLRSSLSTPRTLNILRIDASILTITGHLVGRCRGGSNCDSGRQVHPRGEGG
eukprot:238008-Rhodomonas_salina.2